MRESQESTDSYASPALRLAAFVEWCAGVKGWMQDTYDDGGHKGQGALIYVLDTGVRIDHADFGGRAIAGYSARTGSDWCPRGVVSDTCSCHPHGTHCASTAAGTTCERPRHAQTRREQPTRPPRAAHAPPAARARARACSHRAPICLLLVADGVAKQATIIAVQVLSCRGSGSSSAVIGGIDWSGFWVPKFGICAYPS